MGKYGDAYTASHKAEQLEKVTPDFMKWEKEGQVLLGKLIGVDSVTSRADQSQFCVYTMETDTGMVRFTLGRATDQQIGKVLSLGKIYRIKFDGQQALEGGRKMNVFDIQRIPAPELEGDIQASDDFPF